MRLPWLILPLFRLMCDGGNGAPPSQPCHQTAGSYPEIAWVGLVKQGYIDSCSPELAALVLNRPCLPSPAKAPPTGSNWLHEIKHDGFRIMALRDADGVRLITRNGNDFTRRFPLAVAAVAALPVRRSCLIDGEAIVTGDDGLAVFELIRRARHGAQAVLCAFDLLELDGVDLRRLPLEQRKDLVGANGLIGAVERDHVQFNGADTVAVGQRRLPTGIFGLRSH
jgi:ATP-dependent DNA ligase